MRPGAAVADGRFCTADRWHPTPGRNRRLGSHVCWAKLRLSRMLWVRRSSFRRKTALLACLMTGIAYTRCFPACIVTFSVPPLHECYLFTDTSLHEAIWLLRVQCPVSLQPDQFLTVKPDTLKRVTWHSLERFALLLLWYRFMGQCCFNVFLTFASWNDQTQHINTWNMCNGHLLYTHSASVRHTSTTKK